VIGVTRFVELALQEGGIALPGRDPIAGSKAVTEGNDDRPAVVLRSRGFGSGGALGRRRSALWARWRRGFASRQQQKRYKKKSAKHCMS
jgi:hypothetical protein